MTLFCSVIFIIYRHELAHRYKDNEMKPLHSKLLFTGHCQIERTQTPRVRGVIWQRVLWPMYFFLFTFLLFLFYIFCYYYFYARKSKAMPYTQPMGSPMCASNSCQFICFTIQTIIFFLAFFFCFSLNF